jgi:hypothetical protein
MEEVAIKLSVNSEWLKTGEGSKDARHLRLHDESGNTFDAQAIRGVYTVIEPTDVDLPFYKEVPTAVGSSKTHVIEDPEQSIRLPRGHLDSLEISHTDAICALHDRQQHGRKIEDGSTIAIDRGLTQIVDGEIYAIEHDGMLRIKYLHRMPGNALRCAAKTAPSIRMKSSDANRSKSRTDQDIGLGVLVVDAEQTQTGGAVPVTDNKSQKPRSPNGLACQLWLPPHALPYCWEFPLKISMLRPTFAHRPSLRLRSHRPGR